MKNLIKKNMFYIDNNITEETPEEAANQYAKNRYSPEQGFPEEDYYISFLSFRAGAKWQQERMYSEEDMIKAIKFGSDGMYGWQLGEEGYTVNQIKRFLKTLK